MELKELTLKETSDLISKMQKPLPIKKRGRTKKISNEDPKSSKTRKTKIVIEEKKEPQNLTFTIPSMNVYTIDKKYDINIPLSTPIDDRIENITTSMDKLQLLKSKLPPPDSFIQIKKENIPIYFLLRDFIKGTDYPSTTDVHCHWCRQQFNSHPVGIPIKYNPSLHIDEYISVVSNDKRVIKKEITVKQRIEYENKIKLGKMNGKLEIRENFDVDGVFCSFNCALAYLRCHHISEFKYRFSHELLFFMARQIFGKTIDIKPALHWRYIDIFGGSMDIDFWRKSVGMLNVIEYQSTPNRETKPMKQIIRNFTVE